MNGTNPEGRAAQHACPRLRGVAYRSWWKRAARQPCPRLRGVFIPFVVTLSLTKGRTMNGTLGMARFGRSPNCDDARTDSRRDQHAPHPALRATPLRAPARASPGRSYVREPSARSCTYSPPLSRGEGKETHCAPHRALPAGSDTRTLPRFLGTSRHVRACRRLSPRCGARGATSAAPQVSARRQMPRACGVCSIGASRDSVEEFFAICRPGVR